MCSAECDTPTRDWVHCGANPAPLVATVVLNWQRPDETLACVRSLVESEYSNQRILVVDNDAGASGIESVLVGHPVRVIRNPKNLGFTGGMNVGMCHAVAVGADYVWLVNSDAVVGPHTLTKLVATAESDPKIGLVGPAIHDPISRETPVFYLGAYNQHHSFSSATNSRKEAESWLAYRTNEVFLYGTALLARRPLIEAIGGFDDRFFAYIEDIDYCLRCRQADFKIVPCFDAIVYHRFKDPENQPHLAPPHLHYLVTRNYLLLWRKQSPRLLWQKAALWFLNSRLRQLERMIGLPEQQDALLAGLWDGLRGVSGPYVATRRAPWWVRSTLGRHPRLVINLLDRRLPWRPAIPT
jgi:GT2 family glycosyltransferase